MKKYFIAIFVCILLAVTILVSPIFAEKNLAMAEEQTEYIFVFSADDGDLVVTRKGVDGEVYRGVYNEGKVLTLIKDICGEEEYFIELQAPTVQVSLTIGSAKQDYSAEDKFGFSALTTHGFDDFGIIDYSKADVSGGYEWYFSREGSAETRFGGHSDSTSFGAEYAYGKYEIYAYGSITLGFGGKEYTVYGKSEAVEIEISKVAANPTIEDESSFLIQTTYGLTLGQIIDDNNVKSRDFKLNLAGESTKVYGVGEYGIEVEYVKGTWNGDEFVEDLSYTKVKLTVTLGVQPYYVHILLHHVNIKEGADINLSYHLLAPEQLPNNETIADLDINVYTDGTSDKPGVYGIYAESGNPNYKVIFSNNENRDNFDYSTWATLTVRPCYLYAEDNNLKYTMYRYNGFNVGDEIVFAEYTGNDKKEGSTTLKVYNNYASVQYTDVTLTIEKGSDDVEYVEIYKDGVWQKLSFENDKITLNYSTDETSAFQVLPILKEVAPAETPEENETVKWALLAVFCAIFLCVIVPVVSRRNRYPKDVYVRETRPEKEEDTKGGEEQFSSNLKEEVEESEPRELTLEEKIELHPEYVPTLSLEEAFKEKEEDDDVEDGDSEDTADEGKITFKSKMLSASPENKAIYNALKNELLSYRGIKSRVVNGGDYFRRPGKQVVKIIFIGKTIRLALALNPQDYDYNLYHQKDRGNMKKYADTPMFVKVQSLLGVRRACKLIADLMAKEGIKRNKKYLPQDHLFSLTYGEED